MKPAWKVRRTVAARDDGQRRWDYAYQFLLQWAANASADTCSAATQQEEANERGHLRPGLDPTPTAGADD
jgi:hypothetical protein